MESGKYNTAAAKEQSVSYDLGLRSYMLQVYNYMAAALTITGIVSLFAASSSTVMALMYKTNAAGQFIGMAPLGWVVAIAPIAFVFMFSMGLARMNVAFAKLSLWLFAGMMGLSLSSTFLIYTGESITRVFFISASVFAAMSLYGYTTKKDLTGWGSFLMMGLLGVIIASVVNMFLHSPALQFAASLIGVLIFVGLTAYDTQRIKAAYYSVVGDTELVSKMAVMGALNLYMDFINLFLYMLRFFGDRRN